MPDRVPQVDEDTLKTKPGGLISRKAERVPSRMLDAEADGIGGVSPARGAWARPRPIDAFPDGEAR